MRRLLLALVVAALTFLPALAATHPVAIRDNVFEPSSTPITPGDTVVWTNQGQREHTVTADGSFDSGRIPPLGVYSRTFDTAGTYRYRCTLHGGMSGTVVVQGATSSTSTSSSTTTTRPPTTSTTRRSTTTTTTGDEGAAASASDRGEGDGDPSPTGPALLAALLLAAVSGGAALAVKRGL